MMRKHAEKAGSYRIEEGLERIVSPVNLIFPDRTIKSYRNGTELTADSFDRPYLIKSIAAVDNEVGIILESPDN